MKKSLILILFILPFVLFGQSYDRLSITHNRTGKNYVLKPGDKVVIKGVDSSGKKFKQKGVISRFENKHIVLKDRYSYVPKDGKFISLQEINHINMPNKNKRAALLFASIVVSLLIFGAITLILYASAIFGGISATKFLTLTIVNIFILGFLSSLVVNSGMDRIENLQTEWKIEQINIP
jgi:hypothetical protein